MLESDAVRCGPKCYLRQVQPADAEVFYSWYCNREIQRHLADPWWNPAIDLDTYRRYRFALHLEKSQVCGVLVVCSADDKPIGLVNYFDLDETNHVCEVGIIIGEVSLWRRGYALAALGLLLDFLADDLDICSVRAMILEENTASQSLFSKAGFAKIGRKQEQDYLFLEYRYEAISTRSKLT